MIFETHAHYDDEKFDEDRAEPVSYTHLDVYKRQCLHRRAEGKIPLKPGGESE